MTQNLLSQIFAMSAELIENSRRNGLTLATAESCTGGLIGAAITSISGSSSVFHGGIISYANSVKTSQLSVPVEMLDTYGAVSQQVAEQMAKGCRERLGVNLAISVTGVAGPNGGTPEKPVGTVWIGLATAEKTTAKLHYFPDLSRNKVRDYTCLAAIQSLLDEIG